MLEPPHEAPAADMIHAKSGEISDSHLVKTRNMS